MQKLFYESEGLFWETTEKKKSSPVKTFLKDTREGTTPTMRLPFLRLEG